MDAIARMVDTNNKLCVSLSGGVDSMVLLHMATVINNKLNKCTITAVHINYNNRTTCSEEVAFVQQYCDSLDVSLHVRHITEMTRSRDTNRSLYEETTRKIRFDEYLKQGSPVMLGHNYDDTIENIISNIASCRNYHNLAGMSLTSTERNVTVLRPFLDMTKADIYEYARMNDIAHLEDSTPKWSRRGKLRDHLMPALDHCEPNFIKGLTKIAADLAVNCKLIEQRPTLVSLPPTFLNLKAYTNKALLSCALRTNES